VVAEQAARRAECRWPKGFEHHILDIALMTCLSDPYEWFVYDAAVLAASRGQITSPNYQNTNLCREQLLKNREPRVNDDKNYETCTLYNDVIRFGASQCRMA